jgi:hypothetical protein
MERELTENDLEVAEASVRFAMENCPVDGLLSKEDGSSISLDDLQALLDRVEEIERTPGMRLGGDVLMTLRRVIDYTSENCPVEGVTTFHDGKQISGKNIMELDQKLKEQEKR